MVGQKGQMATVYKLLISAAFAVTLLAIVHTYTQSIHPPITGIEATQSLLESASKTPEKCFSRNPVQFISGQYYGEDMLGKFTERGQSMKDVKNEVGKLFDSTESEIKQDFESKLSVKCDSSTCTLWIGSSTCGQ